LGLIAETSQKSWYDVYSQTCRVDCPGRTIGRSTGFVHTSSPLPNVRHRLRRRLYSR
jgi:hypothetical protein